MDKRAISLYINWVFDIAQRIQSFLKTEFNDCVIVSFFLIQLFQPGLWTKNTKGSS